MRGRGMLNGAEESEGKMAERGRTGERDGEECMLMEDWSILNRVKGGKWEEEPVY